jgi:outer membrane protein OmpA-like peptidoglycan-associated protein
VAGGAVAGGLVGAVLVAGAGAPAAAAVAGAAGPAAATAGTSTPTPTPAPTVLALPPATASVDVGPVVGLVAPTAPLVAPVAELITRTGSVDGAVGHDAAPTQEQYTLAGDVFFETNSADLTERARAELMTIAAALAEAEPAQVAVVGHTDSVDDDAYNQTLSLQRAEAVQTFLAAQVPGLTVTVDGRGESEPLAVEEGSAEQVQQARALNRRVEITATR